MNYSKLKEISLVSLFLTSLISIFFYRVILKTAWIWEDFSRFHFPMKYYIFNSLKDGIFPFWNPYILGGAPAAADIQVGIFYPLNLLLVPLSKPDISYMYWLMEMQAIFHLLLGGLFMYILMRYLKVSRFGSLFSAMIFSLSPLFIVHLKHVNMIESIIWLPLIFLFFHRSLHTNSLRDSIFAGFIMGISILAGHLQMNYLMFLFLFAYFIYFLLKEDDILSLKRPIMRNILLKRGSLFFLFFALSLGIASIELLPYLEFSSLSIRTISDYFSFSSSYSAGPMQFLFTSLVPHFFGGQSISTPYWGEWNYWEMMNYLDIFVLLLIFIGLMFLRNIKIVRFLFTAALLALGLSLGYNFILYYFAYFLLPGLKLFRVPARFLFLYSFSLIIIAGFSLDFFLNSGNLEKLKLFFAKNKKIFQKIAITILAFFAIIAGIYALTPQRFIGVPKNLLMGNTLANISALFILFLALSLIIKGYLKRSLDLKKVKIAFLAFTIADIFWFGFDFNNGDISPKEFYPETKAIEYLRKENPADYRVILNSPTVNTSSVYRIPEIDGWVGPALILNYNNFAGKEKDGKTASWDPSFDEITDSPNRLKLLNACYVAADEKDIKAKKDYTNINGLNLYKTPYCPKRSFIVHKIDVEKDPKNILSKIDKSEFNPLETVILEEKPNLEPITQDKSFLNDSAEIIKYGSNSIEIKSKSEENGILFLSEVYYPGWEAYVDGAKTEVYRADYAFRAIALPKGEHIVKLVYNPKIFRLGLLISLISAMSGVIFCFYLSYRKL